MKAVKKIGYLASGCLALAFILSTGTTASAQSCVYRDNEITPDNLCDGQGNINDLFCQVSNLEDVQNTDRVIWDGSFTWTNSPCTGPGGRWTGKTLQDEWTPLTRTVETRNGDGELVLRGGIDGISARVFGQTFGEAAAYPGGQSQSAEVFVPSNDVIRLSFTASIENGPSDCHLCWLNVMFGERIDDANYVAVQNNNIDGAGHNEYWYIDVQGEVQCSIDFPLDQIGCHNVDISNWLPMIQFGVNKSSLHENIELHIDDIEVNIAEATAIENLIHMDDAEACAAIEGDDMFSWSLITEAHWEGGGVDNTSGISSTCCFADANCDGRVDVMDLLEVISGWGPDSGPGDINCDGATNVTDLIFVLGYWGTICP